jgi:hypothetical protein
MTMNNMANIEHIYSTNAVLLISRYSDTLAVIKKAKNKYVQYVNKSYDEQIPLTRDELYDLFDTSGAILGFHHQVLTAVFISRF